MGSTQLSGLGFGVFNWSGSGFGSLGFGVWEVFVLGFKDGC